MPRAKSTRLTDRQVELLTLLAQGYKGSEIAEQMGITKSAFSSISDRIRHKLEARTSTHAVVIAIRQGLI